jgi:5'-3' exonuclease
MNLKLSLTEMSTNPTFIFIDGSYFCFYRYHSLLTWWKNAYPEQSDVLLDPYQNEKFVEKFKKTFIDNIVKIPKSLNLDKNERPIIIVGKDCKRENIWRTALYPEYKGTRKRNDFKGGPIFKMVYDEDLFIQAGVKHILYHDKLEADDCIAITCKHLLNIYPDCNITIIASDKDYLQLREKRVKIFNLNCIDISKSKWVNNFRNNSSDEDNPECDLFCKIIIGDTSDNILSVFPKCGPKTSLKYYNNKELFESQLTKYNVHHKYIFNKKLIDFNEIPLELINEFKEKNINYLNEILIH